MNKIILTGRLTNDPTVSRTTNNGKETVFARFNLAVNRKFRKDGEQQADFFNCVTFGPQAEFVEKYFKKGMKADLDGHLQTGSYTNKEGQKVNTVDVMVENIEFGEKANSNNSDNTSLPDVDENGEPVF